jgi:hypothetical protein
MVVLIRHITTLTRCDCIGTLDMQKHKKLNDRLGDQRGGSEWELIKILLERDRNSSKTNSVEHRKAHAPHSTFHLPKPRSHWSATGPKNKHYQQPQLLHAHDSGNNSGAGCLEGRPDRVWGAVSPPPPSDREFLRNSSSEHQNTSRFHQRKSLIKVKLAIKKS